ncbi:MAG TPA: hypothetical protein VJC12_00585 [Candidatus Paceibacterota bacterium]
MYQSSFMDPTSFIPKKPETISRHYSGSLFYSLSIIIFIIALLGTGSVFAYKIISERSFSKMQSDLEAARAELQPELIKELSRSNARFEVAQNLINNHTVLSAFFALLESLTVQTVRFTSFTFNQNDRGASVNLNGEARSYSTLASQAKVLSENQNFLSTKFSNLDLNKDGNVIFSLEAQINPKLVSYSSFFGANSLPLPAASPGVPPNQATSTIPASATTTP